MRLPLRGKRCYVLIPDFSGDAAPGNLRALTVIQWLANEALGRIGTTPKNRGESTSAIHRASATMVRAMDRTSTIGLKSSVPPRADEVRESMPAQLPVKSGYTGHYPGKHEFLGSSYRSHDNQIPGRAVMAPPSRELAEKISRPPAKGADSSHAEWIHSQKKLQTVFGADQELNHTDNVRNVVTSTVSRVHAVLSGGNVLTDGMDTQRERQVMRGYTGHVPAARDVVATGYRGYVSGNAYRGPQCPPDTYHPPMPPNRCSEGP